MPRCPRGPDQPGHRLEPWLRFSRLHRRPARDGPRIERRRPRHRRLSLVVAFTLLMGARQGVITIVRGPVPLVMCRRPGPRSGARGHRHPVLVVNAATPTAFAWIVDRWGWPAARVALPASAGRLARDAGDGALVRASGAAGPSQLLTIGLIWRTIPASREPRRADWRGSGSRAAPSTFHTQGDIAWHNPHRRRRPAVTS